MTDFVAATIARLTGPGGEFELAEEDVRGVRLPVFVNRKRSLADVLAESVALGDREYLVCGEQRMTYAQHASAVASLSRALAERYGVGAGDRIALLGANSPQWVVAFWAAAGLGAITAAFNAWWTRPEIAYGIEHSRPSVLFVDAKRAPLVGAVDIPVLSIETDLPRLAAEYPDAALPDAKVHEDEPAAILFTSGTTGHPKGALHSVRNMLAVLEYHRLNDAIAAALGAAPTIPRRFLMSMPLFHIGSLHNLVLPRLATGDTVVMNQGGFDVDRVLRLIERERITNWAIVPTMAHRIVEHDNLDQYDLSSLTALSVNSAPSSPALKERLRQAVPAVKDALADSYGLTESSTAATIAPAAVLAEHPTTVGSPIVGVRIEIRDADGLRLPDGVEGEICLRSQFNMLGYWNDDAATAAVFAPDGWLRTGDIGCLRDGRLYMSTRRSDLILRGGENVYPAEVEAVLDECPGVAESAVYGVEHPDLGQEVAAIVVAEDGAVTVDALRDFVNERLAYYKIPTQWQLTTTPLPRTATGKVIRRQFTGH